MSLESMIGQRPAEAADRAMPGHWKGDRILGRDWSMIGTLGGVHHALHPTAAFASHDGPWPGGSREELPRICWTRG